MSILFAATEIGSFVTAGGSMPTVSTSSANFDANFSRCALGLNSTGPTLFRPVNLLGDIAEAWFHFRWSDTTIGTTNHTLVEIQNSSGVGVLRIRSTSTSQWQFQYWNGSTWVQISTQNEGATAVTIDIRSKINDSTGVFELWVGGVSVGSLTGDTNLFSGSANDRILFGDMGSGVIWMSEVIMADEDTRGMRVATLVPNANGTYTTWTGTYADVDETDNVDNEFISSTTGNELESFGLTDLSSVAAGYDPIAVTIESRGRIGATGPTNFQTLLRTNSTDYLSSNKNPTSTFDAVTQTVYDVNPNTSAEWTISEINALEIGVKSIT